MIGEALRLVRVFHDLKQVDAASRLGISQSYLSEVENGTKSPTLDVLHRYSEVFDVPLSSIVYFSEHVGRPDGATGMVAEKIIRLLQFIEQRSGKTNAASS